MDNELTTAQLARHWRVSAKRISERAATRGIEPVRIVGRRAYWPSRARAFLGPVPAGMPGHDATERIRTAWARGRNHP